MFVTGSGNIRASYNLNLNQNQRSDLINDFETCEKEIMYVRNIIELKGVLNRIDKTFFECDQNIFNLAYELRRCKDGLAFFLKKVFDTKFSYLDVESNEKITTPRSVAYLVESRLGSSKYEKSLTTFENSIRRIEYRKQLLKAIFKKDKAFHYSELPDFVKQSIKPDDLIESGVDKSQVNPKQELIASIFNLSIFC